MENPSPLEGLLECLYDSKAEKIWVYQVKEYLSYTDTVVVLTSLSDSHTRALIDKTRDHFKKMEISPFIHVRKQDNYHWAVLDYGSIIIHYFQDSEREFYALDEHFQKVLPPANQYPYPDDSSVDSSAEVSAEESHELGT